MLSCNNTHHHFLTLIYYPNSSLYLSNLIGEYKACEAVISVLHKHSIQGSISAVWACKALVALCLHEQNKLRFVNSETCTSIVKALEVYLIYSM